MAAPSTVFRIGADTTEVRIKMKMLEGEMVLSFENIARAADKSTTSITRTAMAVNFLSGAGKAAQTALLAMGVSLLAGAAAFGLTTKAVAQFDETIRRAAAIANLDSSETAHLIEVVNELASTYGIAGEQIALGAVELLKAGVGADELFEALETITQATLDSTIDFTTAAEIYVKITRAFAKEGLSAATVFDLLRTAANAAILDVGDILPVLQTAASMFSLVGLQTEDLIALSAALTQVGISTNVGATGMRQLLVDMLENREAIEAWAQSLGVTVPLVKDGKLNIDEFVLAFKDMDIELESVTEALGFFERRSANAFFGLIRAGPELIRIQAEMADSFGATARFAELMTTSLSSLWNQIVQTFFAEIRTPELMETLRLSLIDLLDAVKEIGPELGVIIKELIVQFADNLPTLITFFRNVISVIDDLMPVISALASGMSVLLGFFDAIGTNATIWVVALGLLTKSFVQLALAGSAANIAAGAMTAGFFGLLLLFSDAPGPIRALGAVILGLTVAFWGLAAAQAAAKGPLGLADIATWVAIAAAVAGISAGISLALRPPEFHRGLEFAPTDEVVRIHRGERILTAEENRFFTGGIHGGNFTFNVYDATERDVDELLMRFNR